MAAINSSQLELLSLNTNRYLSDAFLADFLSALDAPHLRELQISAIGLTSLSGTTVANYLSSPRCHLHLLKCNGNSLGLRAIRSIVRAIGRNNYRLRSIELYANQLQDDRTESPSGSDASGGEGEDQRTDRTHPLRSWKDCEPVLRNLLFRNTHLKREVSKQSITLLRYARPLLLQSKLRRATTEGDVPLQTHSPPSFTSRQEDSDCVPPFPFRCLPLELQHYTLSFFAPSLSSSQRIRIFNYASSADTLPQLLPPLSTLTRSVRFGPAGGIGCIPDPSSIEYALGGTVWPIQRNQDPFHPTCTMDRCMGSSNSLLCRREKERLQFLEAVGCDTYELEPGEKARAARELYTLSLI